jgi:hypothetical protein
MQTQPDSGLLVRVGIPEPTGKLPFHAFEKEYATMVSAQAFWNPKSGKFRIPEASDLFETDFALDSAGFTAMRLWKEKGAQPGMAGIYPWSYSDYMLLASELSPTWFSAPDLCVENEIATSQAEVDFRIDATATLLEGCLRIAYEWQNQLARTCSSTVARNLVPTPIPVIQGWTTSDYQRSLELTMSVLERWTPWLQTPTLIGVGSVCRREVNHPKHGLLSVLAGIEPHLPSSSKLHLFGVKGTCLSTIKMLRHVASTDSMAYDFSARMNAHRAGQPNSIANRTAEMTRWMTSALLKAAPAAGDQFRLI